MKNVSTQQRRLETFCFEPMVSDHISMCLVVTRGLSFDVLVPGADVAAATMPVLDRPGERAVQIRQAAR